MRLTSNLRIRCGFLFAVSIVLASATFSAPASAEEPPQVVILDGPAAALLESQNRPVKPVLRGLTGEHGETLVVVLFASDPQRAAELPDELFSTDPVADCEGGVTCCDPTKGVMVVNATYNGQNGWVQTGELCEPQGIEEVGVDEAPPSVSSELSGRFGITDCLMKIVDDKGYPKLLVNGSVEACIRENHSDAEGALPTMARAAAQDGGALWLTSLITPRTMPQATSPIILASHCQSARPTACPGTDSGATLCGMAADRWFSFIGGLWCRFDRCGPC